MRFTAKGVSWRLSTALVTGTFSALVTTPVFAQVETALQSAPGAAIEEGAAGGSDIVVTARRREEKLQDVPVAVTVLSTEAIREANLERFDDLQRTVPALQIQGTSNGNATPAFTIRSQRNSDAPITLDPAVSIYFAEVPQARPQGLTGGLFDLQSIQVLKGPQGTLFGRNSTGGAIVLTPAAPTDKFEGYARATLGNYDTHNFEAVVNAPLADWAALRIGGQINRHDGYVRNVMGGRLNNAHNGALRGSLKLTPADTLTNTTVVNYFSSDESGPALRSRFVGPISTTFFPGLVAANTRSNARDFWTVANNIPGRVAIKNTLVSNITELKLGGVTLKNVAGYRRVKSRLTIDIDGTELQVYRIRNIITSKQYSNELQLLGQALDDRLDYIAGAFYFQEKAFEDDTSFRAAAVANAAQLNLSNIDNVSKSLFTQATLRVPGFEGLSLTAGGRYTWDKRELTSRGQAGTYNPLDFSTAVTCSLRSATNVVLDPCVRNLKKNFRKFTYTLTVDYKVAPDILIYAAHRSGYRSGGFNARATSALLAVPFEPENVKDFELGVKSEFQLSDDVRARFNIAAYHQDYKNIQRSVGGTDTTGAFIGTTVRNAASATIKGIEPELTLNFGRALTVNTYYSYSRGKYKSYPAPRFSGGVIIIDDLSPSPFAGAPKHSGGATVTWRLPLADEAGDVKLIGNYYAQSKTYGSDNTYTVAGGISPFGVVPRYQLVNGRIQWDGVLGTAFSAAGYVRNLFKEKYITSALDTVNVGLGTSAATVGDPRTFGVELGYRW
jgi:iron complex outermembrane receptor protein